MYSCDEVMHFVIHFIFLIFTSVILFFTLLIKEILRTFHLGSTRYKGSKQHVGAGIGTLMSISDGFGRSIFCRKMEKRVQSWRRWMESCLFPATVGIFNFEVLMSEVFFPISACKQLFPYL